VRTSRRVRYGGPGSADESDRRDRRCNESQSAHCAFSLVPARSREPSTRGSTTRPVAPLRHWDV